MGPSSDSISGSGGSDSVIGPISGSIPGSGGSDSGSLNVSPALFTGSLVLTFWP